MKQSLVGKCLVVVCLCLVFLGVPVALGACSFKTGEQAPAVGSSWRNPYSVTIFQGKCTSWRILVPGANGKFWCAASMPTTHIGDYVRFSFGVLSQLFPQIFSIVSVDGVHHLITVSYA